MLSTPAAHIKKETEMSLTYARWYLKEEKKFLKRYLIKENRVKEETASNIIREGVNPSVPEGAQTIISLLPSYLVTRYSVARLVNADQSCRITRTNLPLLK
jgi:hypothetical protein